MSFMQQSVSFMEANKIILLLSGLQDHNKNPQGYEDRMNCFTCTHAKTVPLYTAVAGLDRWKFGERQYCSHTEQPCPTPWISGNSGTVYGGKCPITITTEE